MGEELITGSLDLLVKCNGVPTTTNGWLLPNSTARVFLVSIQVGVDGGTIADVQYRLYDSDNKTLASNNMDHYAEPNNFTRDVWDWTPNWVRMNGAIYMWVLCSSSNNPAASVHIGAMFYYVTP